ncbi:25448_t:CDS:2, partial [Dentiscutata erythropus]
ILAITTNNASNNSTMFEYFTKLCLEKQIIFDEENYRVKYLGHVINLAVQNILKKLKAESPNQDKDILEKKNNINSMTTIEKLCKIITYAQSIPQRKKKFMNYNSSKLELIVDIKTRWNSTYYMPINIITTIEKEIKKYELNKDDWNLIEEFNRDATTYISGSTYSTIGLIVPAYNALLDILEKFVKEKSTVSIIKNTAQFGINKLEKYYSSTEGLAYI